MPGPSASLPPPRSRLGMEQMRERHHIRTRIGLLFFFFGHLFAATANYLRLTINSCTRRGHLQRPSEAAAGPLIGFSRLRPLAAIKAERSRFARSGWEEKTEKG